MKPELIKELFSLWESMAECGQLTIGPKFSAQYKRLKIDVEEALLKDEVRRNRNKSYHKKWRDKPESKGKIKGYNERNKEWHKLRYVVSQEVTKALKFDQVKKELVTPS